jgi:hypothetical protein
MFMPIESLTNLTLPSPNPTLTPPGWLLLAFEKFAALAALGQLGTPPLPPPMKEQVFHGYCFELGGTTVLNIVKPVLPRPQI